MGWRERDLARKGGRKIGLLYEQRRHPSFGGFDQPHHCLKNISTQSRVNFA